MNSHLGFLQVAIQWARHSAATLRAAGVADYTLTEYKHLGHSASQREIDDVLSWLRERLPEV